VKEKLSQKELADRLDVVPRQVHNLVNEGMPTKVQKGKRFYPWPECNVWYIDYKIRSAAPKPDKNRDRMAELELRREEVAVRSAELKLGKEEARLVSINYMEHQLSTILDGLRGKLLSFSGKHASDLVSLATPAEVRAKLDTAIEEVMQALVEVGEDPALDENDGDDNVVNEYQELQPHGGSLQRRKVERDDE
jgi:phage terminase Nu1 subunit (DNA packaging protein)